MPSPHGAHGWQAMSFSPDTQLAYFAVQDIPFAYVDDPKFQPRALGENLGIDLPKASLPRDAGLRAQVLASVRGFLKAWDPVAQREVWRVEQPGAWNGGVLSTAGALVFEGNAAGQFNAYHATTGATLWSFAAQGGIVAAPIAFMSGGDEYIAIVVGWGGAFPLSGGELARKGAVAHSESRILAFRLGASLQLPQSPAAPISPAPPERFGDDELLQLGMRAYHEHCSRCHGDAAVSGGVLPDLRQSTALADVGRWRQIVHDGALAARGMVSFRSLLTPAAEEAIRAYVIERAHAAWAEEAVKGARVTPAE
jgi:alcohol dehydrogenase (cytochrome c)/quinohemoprotein ethanol dehydrogenase